MRFVYVVFSLIICFFLSHFIPRNESLIALEDVKRAYFQDLDSWENATKLYVKSVDKDSLQLHHANTRFAFKKIEWLAAYFDESAIKHYINGAPLPAVEQKVADLTILEPSGFQILEEHIYADELDAEVEVLLVELRSNTTGIVRDLKKRIFSYADIFAAARYGLIRIYTLGVTGFDTPGSGLALAENAIALRSIRSSLEPFLVLENDLPTSTKDSIYEAFEAGIAQLENGEFDSFDRLEFLVSCINPLYDKLLSVHEHVGAEMPKDLSIQAEAHNYQSRNLFDDSFLNDFYFANQPADDSLFSRKRELGKRLFFDSSLSDAGTLSCASCHNPDKAFTDGLPKSKGNDGNPLQRNSPTLIGAVYAERYFADMREPTLARQIRHVVQDQHEFGTDFLSILTRLQRQEAYRSAFDEAYTSVDSTYRMSVYSLSDALASYVRSLHSNSSPIDSYIRGEREDLSKEIRLGYNIFMGKALCGTCHFAPTFAGLVPPFYRESESEVLGIPSEWPIRANTPLDMDPGRIATGMPLDNAPFYALSFKTPTVRNSALTAPYMHNGSMDSLIQVVDFYNKGGGAGLGFPLEHQTLPFDNLNLEPSEMGALVTFLEALTDQKSVD